MTPDLETLVRRLPPLQRRRWAAACVARCAPLVADWPAVATWLDGSLRVVAVVASRPACAAALARPAHQGARLFHTVLAQGGPPRVWYTIRAARRLLVADPAYPPAVALAAADQAALAHGDAGEADERAWQRDAAIRAFFGIAPIPFRRKGPPA
jgi:hypothetical protein